MPDKDGRKDESVIKHGGREGKPVTPTAPPKK